MPLFDIIATALAPTASTVAANAQNSSAIGTNQAAPPQPFNEGGFYYAPYCKSNLKTAYAAKGVTAAVKAVWEKWAECGVPGKPDCSTSNVPTYGFFADEGANKGKFVPIPDDKSWQCDDCYNGVIFLSDRNEPPRCMMVGE